MTAPVLADALGPRARRRVRIASFVAAGVLVVVVYVAFRRLSDKGQLEWAKWEPLTQWSVLKFLLLGLGVTVKTAAAGMAIALVLGAGLALMRLSRTAPVRWFATAWVELFRGFPLLLLIFFIFFALPKYGVTMTPFRALVLGLALYNGAMLGEIFRAGILSLDRGQSEAAYAIGLTYWQAMFLVIVPQAARRMLPAIISQMVTLLKDTSLGFIIAYEELLRRGRETGEFFANPLQTLVFVALVYIAVNFTLSRIAQTLEARQRRRYGASSVAHAGAEDLAVVSAAVEV
ncbi:MAG: amino acid ABC transporter permease [Actinobacteria bacterium]|nr:amino acid ABC transporter permease [Actinomycetota bacterium]